MRPCAPRPKRVPNPYSPERANGHACGCGIVRFDGISGGMVGGTPAGSFGGGMLLGAGDGTPTGSGPRVSAGRGEWVGAGLGTGSLGQRRTDWGQLVPQSGILLGEPIDLSLECP